MTMLRQLEADRAVMHALLCDMIDRLQVVILEKQALERERTRAADPQQAPASPPTPPR